MLDFLTIMYMCCRYRRLYYKLTFYICFYMIFISEITAALFLCPPRISIFLTQFSFMLFPCHFLELSPLLTTVLVVSRAEAFLRPNIDSAKNNPSTPIFATASPKSFPQAFKSSSDLASSTVVKNCISSIIPAAFCILVVRFRLLFYRLNFIRAEGLIPRRLRRNEGY